VTFAALGFDANGMWERLVLTYERYRVVTGRASDPLSRVSGPAEFHRIDKKTLSFSGSQILASMTFKALIVRRGLRLWSTLQTHDHDK
jgi:hypothetical protein